MRFNFGTGIAAGILSATAGPAALGQSFAIFQSRSQFNEFIKGPPAHCLPKGGEDFEESTLALGGSAILNDPLTPGVPNGPFLAGLSQPNLRVQSNTLGGTALVTAPRGVEGLYTEAIGALFGDVVLSNFVADSLDLIFLDEDKCAVGFDVLNMGAVGGVQVSVFDAANVMIAQQNVAGGSFFGIVILEPNLVHIGRINIFGITATGAGVREGADNISLFVDVPAPAGACVLVAAGAAAFRRRRVGP